MVAFLAHHIRCPRRAGFTLLELLVTTAVLGLFVVLLLSVTDSSFRLWRQTAADISMFDAARAAYDTMTRRLSQATLNTYLDYYDSQWKRRGAGHANFVPARYGRASDLAFYSGPADAVLTSGGPTSGHGVFFFAPLGYVAANATLADLASLLNPVGYYVEWGSDVTLRPSFLASLPARYRFRLIEAIQPSQNFSYYPQLTDDNRINDFPENWVSATAGHSSAVRNVLAENILLLIIRPELPERDVQELFGPSAKPWDITADYVYDSRAGESRSTNPEAAQFAQLPPMLRVVMVAISEKDAARLIGNSSSIPTPFQLNPSWFQIPSNLEADLAALASQLAAANIQFRVFNSVIPLRSAKFSARKEH